MFPQQRYQLMVPERLFCYWGEGVGVKMSTRLSHKSFVISLSSDSFLAVLWIDLINTHAVITRSKYCTYG